MYVATKKTLDGVRKSRVSFAREFTERRLARRPRRPWRPWRSQRRRRRCFNARGSSFIEEQACVLNTNATKGWEGVTRRRGEKSWSSSCEQEASTKSAHTCGTLMIMKGDKGGWQFAKSRLKDGDLSPIWINARSTTAERAGERGRDLVCDALEIRVKNSQYSGRLE